MYRDNVVAVVIPAHNEEAHIEQVVRTLPSFVDRVIVTDDGSSDRTSEIVLGVARDDLTLIRHPENRGVGAAVVSGYRRALEGDPDIVVLMQGDEQTDPAQMHRLLDPIVEGRYDFAKGNRFFSWRSFRGMPFLRVVGNVGLSSLMKLASGYWQVFDSLNGYTAISSGLLRTLPLDRLESRYELETLMLLELRLAGARVTDVAIPAVYGEEVSGVQPWREGRRILWTMLRGLFRRVRIQHLGKRPTLAGVSFAAGVTLTLAGIVGSLAAIATSLAAAPWLLAFAAGIVRLAFFFAVDALGYVQRIQMPRRVGSRASASR